MITADELRQIIPGVGERADLYAEPLSMAMREFAIENPVHAAMWIAQVAHESAALKAVSENLNYSAEALLRVFPKYFNSSEAAVYARQPERIANRVYANRMGNGDEASGDGWRYRGAGLIQLTGKSNQCAAADYFGINHEGIGDWLRTPEGAARSAGWFWHANNLGRFADADDFRGLTRAINGGYHGYEDRLAYYERAQQVIG